MRPEAVRARLAFDVERLRASALRLEAVDEQLSGLKARLEARASALASEARGAGPLLGGDGRAQIRSAQAHATALLALRAALGEVLRSPSPLALIVAMAVGRWVGALKELRLAPVSETTIRAHIEAGRIAHRLLVTLRPRDELRSGLGQLTSAVVVAEFVHEANLDDVDEQIDEGLHRAQTARGVRSPEDAVEIASRGLRAAARLLESMAERGEPAVFALLQEADVVEADVALRLSAASEQR